MSLRFKKIFERQSKKLVTFTTGGDPDLETSKKILEIIADNNIDIVEIGMPFSDPMADGPIIQLSSNRAINKGINLDDIFSICKKFNATEYLSGELGIDYLKTDDFKNLRFDFNIDYEIDLSKNFTSLFMSAIVKSASKPSFI